MRRPGGRLPTASCAWGVEEVEVDHDGALALAMATGLTYDAAYLWLKRQLGADLVTLEQRLAKADASSPR